MCDPQFPLLVQHEATGGLPSIAVAGQQLKQMQDQPTPHIIGLNIEAFFGATTANETFGL